MKWDVLLGITSSIGLIHALLFALFLINSKRGDRITNVLLAALLASFAIRIFKSTFYALNGSIPAWLPSLGLMSMSVNGPLMLFYVKRLTQENISIRNIVVPVACFAYAATTMYVVNDLYVRIAYLVIIVASAIYIVAAAMKVNSLSQIQTRNWLIALTTAFVIIELIYFLQWTGLGELAYVVATTVSSVSLMALTYLCLLKYDLLKKLHRPADNLNSPEDVRACAAIRQIIIEQQGYLDAEISMLRLAKMLGFSQARMSACFQKEFNATFPETINRLRLDYVVHRLRDNENVDKIEAIARDAGFPSPSSFYAHFKKAYRMTPLEYRTRALAVVQG